VLAKEATKEENGVVIITKKRRDMLAFSSYGFVLISII
jgi:hypothetical protein